MNSNSGKTREFEILPELEALKKNFDREVKSFQGIIEEEEFKQFRQKYLGKKSPLNSLSRHMGTLPPEEKPKFGQALHRLRNQVDSELSSISNRLETQKINATLQSSTLDSSLPGIGLQGGSIHPVNRVRDEIINFFSSIGFQIMGGREVETDWYNFEALNIPPFHPARDMQDTFYVDEGVVLRTQTSNVQIHAMENQKPPLRLIAPGTVYRADSDSSHAPVFQQVEGLMVDEGISFAHLKGFLYLWVKKMFGPEVTLRFRPSFFPFTEPSAEMDVSSPLSKTGWMEIGGCGCVNPKVLEKAGIDSERYTGFAFGFGIDRIAMIRYGIPEIGLLTQNDLRFLRQF